MKIKQILVVFLALVLASCASVSQSPEPPKLSVMSVVPHKLGLASQVFRFTLNAHNSNAFSLPVESLEFVTRFSGIEVGTGRLSQPVTLTPNADTAMVVDVDTNLANWAGSLGELLSRQRLNFDYEIDGSLKTAAGKLFPGKTLPIKLSGNLIATSPAGP